ncbi:IS5 family transposase ISAcma20 [Planctomycetes bacterium FF15]|uniref:IS5 family transposase ISAcma20 n=1 Tax=Bremerella alba TaxID=980252 RepID=A0A7V8V8D6_9BACT|nr:IS5 family transposase ISAcma20 [Bremerella alba]
MEARYPTDLTDAQWKRIACLIPAAKPGGRPRSTSIREVLNAILYLTKSGCQWRMLPRDFPSWKTVYWYFTEWKNDGTLQRIHDSLRHRVREQEGRHRQPSVAIIDSQSVKTPEKGGVDSMVASS